MSAGPEPHLARERVLVNQSIKMVSRVQKTAAPLPVIRLHRRTSTRMSTRSDNRMDIFLLLPLPLT
jgi:hypothetical protein